MHELSTMQRAVGGAEGLPAQSPLLVLTNALARQQEASLWQQQQEEGPPGAAPATAHEAVREADAKAASSGPRQQQQQQPQQPQQQQQELAGEAIARRIGFSRASSGSRRNRAVPAAPSGSGGGKGMLQFSTEDAAALPPTVLMSSCTDEVVPWCAARRERTQLPALLVCLFCTQWRPGAFLPSLLPPPPSDDVCLPSPAPAA